MYGSPGPEAVVWTRHPMLGILLLQWQRGGRRYGLGPRQSCAVAGCGGTLRLFCSCGELAANSFEKGWVHGSAAPSLCGGFPCQTCSRGGLVLLVAMLLAAFIPRGKFGAALAASLPFLVSVLDACCDALRVWPKFLKCLDQIISDLRWISQVARQLHPSSSMGSATAPAGEQQLVSVLVRRTRSSH